MTVSFINQENEEITKTDSRIDSYLNLKESYGS